MVVAARVDVEGERVDERDADAVTRHPGGLSFGVGGVAIGALAQLAGAFHRMVGEDVAETLAVGDPASQLKNRLLIAFRDLDAAGIGGVDDALLPQFDGPDDRVAGRADVQAELVAQVVVLRSGSGALGVLNDMPRIWTLPSMPSPLVPLYLPSLTWRKWSQWIGQPWQARLFSMRGTKASSSISSIATTQHHVRDRRSTVGATDPSKRAPLARALVHGVALIPRPLGLTQPRELLGSGEVDAAAAANGHGLESLRSPDRAQPSQAGGVGHSVHDAGGQAQMLAGRADAQRTDAVQKGGAARAGAMLIADRLPRLPHVLAPQMPRVDESDLLVLDPEIGRMLGLPTHDDGVVACVLHLGSEGAADVRAAVDAGERRLADHFTARRRRSQGAGQGTRRDDDHVVGPERLGLRSRQVVQQADTEAPGADVGPRPVLGQGLHFVMPGGQVDPQQPSAPALARTHGSLLSKDPAPPPARLVSLTSDPRTCAR